MSFKRFCCCYYLGNRIGRFQEITRGFVDDVNEKMLSKKKIIGCLTPTGRATATAVDITSTIFRCYLQSVRGDMVGICKQTADYCIKARLCEKKL